MQWNTPSNDKNKLTPIISQCGGVLFKYTVVEVHLGLWILLSLRTVASSHTKGARENH